MKLDVRIAGNIAAMMAAEVAAGEKAVTTTVNNAGIDLKSRWRAQVTGAGLGRRLGNSIRNRTFPKGQNSLDAAALVWSNAPEIISSFDKGVTIRSSSGFFLAIPTPAAGRGIGGKRLTPGEWEKRRGVQLRFVFRRGKPSLLVAEARVSARGIAARSRSKTGRGVATVPIFVLVPQVTLRKRLDLDRDADAVASAIPGHIVRNWISDRTGT